MSTNSELLRMLAEVNMSRDRTSDIARQLRDLHMNPASDLNERILRVQRQANESIASPGRKFMDGITPHLTARDRALAIAQENLVRTSKLHGIAAIRTNLLDQAKALNAESAAKIQDLLATVSYGASRSVTELLKSAEIDFHRDSIAKGVEALYGASTLADMAKKFEVQRADLARSAFMGLSGTQSIFEESKRWQRDLASLGRSSVSELAVANALGAAASFQSNIDRLKQNALGGLYQDMGKTIAKALIEPSLVYGEFSRRTLNRIATEKNELNVLAYSRSLIFAEQQIARTNESVGRFLSQRGDHHDRLLLRESQLNLFHVQRRDLRLNSERLVDDPEVCAEGATTAGSVNTLAINCMDKLAYINDNAQMKGLEPIFPPTNKMIQAATRLPLICAQNHEQFAAVVDYLFFTFYEGAGADKLRFVSHGLVTPDESDAIFLIKHLRNKWLRHDIEHGSTRDIRTKFRNVSETIGRLGLGHLPRKAHEYSLLHLNLLKEIDLFLELLIERICQVDGSAH